MKLQSLTIIFIIIILPIVLVLSAYIGYEIKTINKQNMYNTGLQTATHDAIFAFEMNTRNDSYSNNAENKRSNIKASIKTFENSLSTACNLGLYNNELIEEYIPAIVFGLYDGFYMYSPSENQDKEYKHNLRNYVYYSEEIKQGNIDIIIRYTLDNYVAVSGTVNGKYITKAGYLVNLQLCENYTYTIPNNIDDKLGEASLDDDFTYQGAKILNEETLYYMIIDEESETVKAINSGNGIKDSTGIEYYKDSIAFSEWFNHYIGQHITEEGTGNKYLYLDDENDEYDPEYENSYFVQHKRQIMKQKIENVLNSSITAYANKTRTNYKMPKFSEEDWGKIYNNISVISFVQGMNLGFKNYNNYCVLNSTNSSEYVNPNLMYFTDGNSYHDIRCDEIKDIDRCITGYRIGSFEKQTYEVQKKDEDGNLVSDAQGNPVTENKYYYKHNELACYTCINGSKIGNGTIYDYVKGTAPDNIKISYFTSLARERYNTAKLLSSYNDLEIKMCTIKYKYTNSSGEDKEESILAKKGEILELRTTTDIIKKEGKEISGWKIEATDEAVASPYTVISDVTLVPNYKDKVQLVQLHHIEAQVVDDYYFYPDFDDNIDKNHINVTAYYTDGTNKKVNSEYFYIVESYIQDEKYYVTVGYKEEIEKTANVEIPIKRGKVLRTKDGIPIDAYQTLYKAVKAAQDNETIIVCGNIEETDPVTVRNKGITIKGKDDSVLVKFFEYCKLTIDSDCSLTLEEINMNFETAIDSSRGIDNEGKLTIKSGNYHSDRYVLENDKELIIEGGKFVSTGRYAIYIDGQSSSDIQNAEISVSGTSEEYFNEQPAGIYCWWTNEMKIKNVKFYGANWDIKFNTSCYEGNDAIKLPKYTSEGNLTYTFIKFN